MKSLKPRSGFGWCPLLAPALLAGLIAGPAQAQYTQSNLVSDLTGVAARVDPNLVNPWGIAALPTGPLWVSDNGMGVSTIYNGAGVPQPLVVTIPAPAGATPPSGPTGIVANSSSDFSVSGSPARFIFATENGTLSAWNPSTGTTAPIQVDNSASGAVYKGLAQGSTSAGNFLYATNFHAGTVDMFSSSFSQVSTTGKFTDPNLPSGYAPFGIQNIGGNLYVTYALQDQDQHDDVAGPGHGFVDVFDTSGNLLQRFASDATLNSPWGLALAPANFGTFSKDLLVGNFGDGRINAFDPTTHSFLGQLTNTSGQPITIQGLWGLLFGNGVASGATNQLNFTAGIAGPEPGSLPEDHGLLGTIMAASITPPPIPEPGILQLLLVGGAMLFLWPGLPRGRRLFAAAA